jgi:hypothetical protein
LEQQDKEDKNTFFHRKYSGLRELPQPCKECSILFINDLMPLQYLKNLRRYLMLPQCLPLWLPRQPQWPQWCQLRYLSMLQRLLPRLLPRRLLRLHLLPRHHWLPLRPEHTNLEE